MTNASATQHVNVDVTGRSLLALKVIWTGSNNAYDHTDWAGAQLLTTSTSTSASTTAAPATYTLSVTSPAPNATVQGTITIAGLAPGFLNVEVSNSSGTLLARTTPNGAGAYAATVDTTKLPNGNDTLTINAWDAPAGQAFTHTAQATLPLNVSNSDPAPPPTSTLPAPIAGTNYQLKWNDEFNGTSIDTSKWNEVGPWGHPVASDMSNFSYSPSNDSEANGVATITAKESGGNWTGGILSTDQSKTFQYGFFEARIQLPAGAGFWPALWLSHTNAEQTLGELDMMEFVGGDVTRIYQTMHTDSGSWQQAVPTNTNWTSGYHLLQMWWQPGRVTFYIDNVQTGSFTTNVPADQMYLMLNFDVGGSWPGNPNSSTPTTAHYNIDYVRVYQ
jgi:beta-glucanase (GH16 family)